MSMISTQCDELRKAADELQDIIDNAHNYTWSGLIVILGYAQRGLRQAADTVWELSNKLAGMVEQQDEIERLKVENAKLIGLVQRRVKDYMYESCGDCWGGLCEECQCWVSECADELCELGVEV